MTQPRILIIEDDPVVAESVRQALTALGHRVLDPVATAEEALDLARRARPDLALVDVGLAGGLDGLELAAALRDELSLPTVFVTGRSDDMTLLRLRLADAVGFLPKPFTDEELAVAVSIALARVGRERRLVEQERHYRTLYRESVAGLAQFTLDGRVVEANDALAVDLGYDSAEDLRGRTMAELWVSNPRTLMVDLGTEGQIRDREVLVRRRDGSSVWLLCNATLVDDGGVGSKVVLATFFNVSRRKELERVLQDMAYHDPLTALPNRRLLELRGAQIVREATRRGEWGAFLYLDVVGFKAVNDRLGHAAGDALLVALARRLEERRRASDLVARLGGDEFGVLLGGAATVAGAHEAARRLLRSLDEPLPLDEGPAGGVHLRVRAGMAVFPDHGATLGELVAAADLALARATSLGGTRLVTADGVLP